MKSLFLCLLLAALILSSCGGPRHFPQETHDYKLHHMQLCKPISSATETMVSQNPSGSEEEVTAGGTTDELQVLKSEPLLAPTFKTDFKPVKLPSEKTIAIHLLKNQHTGEQTIQPTHYIPVSKAYQRFSLRKLLFHFLKPDGNMKLLAVLVSIFLPFVGVAIYENKITVHFWIALLLTLLFYLPGLIYALVIIFS